MRTVYEMQIAETTAIERRIRQGSDRIVSAPEWVWVAKRLWPLKTAANLATIAKSNERTAFRWLSGEVEPPNCIVLAVMQRLFGR